MKQLLNRLINHETITKQEARDVLVNISEGKYNSSQIASFLTVYMMRSITVEELEGFRDALLDLCIAVNLKDYNPIDLCGTGGDGKDTFNISTLSSFVTAGAGVNVTKHGNYGVSSSCGSSNVMEHLGIKFSNDTDFLKRCIDKAGICVLHAPLFHPAMKEVAPIRKALAVKTFFNMLGPIVNPSFPKNQMVGVFNLELARIYNYLLQDSGKNYKVLHSLDGYDEISLTGQVKMISNNGEDLIHPNQIGFKQLTPQSIYGGETVEEAANIFVDVLINEGTKAQEEVVIANSAFAINCFEPNKSFEDCKAIAIDSLKSGRAFSTLKKLTTNN